MYGCGRFSSWLKLLCEDKLFFESCFYLFESFDILVKSSVLLVDQFRLNESCDFSYN